jgi:hypothetical protein
MYGIASQRFVVFLLQFSEASLRGRPLAFGMPLVHFVFVAPAPLCFSVTRTSHSLGTPVIPPRQISLDLLLPRGLHSRADLTLFSFRAPLGAGMPSERTQPSPLPVGAPLGRLLTQHASRCECNTNFMRNELETCFHVFLRRPCCRYPMASSASCVDLRHCGKSKYTRSLLNLSQINLSLERSLEKRAFYCFLLFLSLSFPVTKLNLGCTIMGATVNAALPSTEFTQK